GGHARGGVRAVRRTGRGARRTAPPPRRPRRGRPRRGDRPVPQRLARLAGPRPGRHPPARPRPRTRRRRGRGRPPSHPLAPGDRVTAPFVCACGACPACAAGDQQVCERQTQPGFTHWGSFAQYVALDHADVNLVAVPADLSFATAASLGCRFATAYRAVVQQGRVAAGEWVAVHGCGGVGLSAVMIAAAAGARVVAVDVSPKALELAERFGATRCIDASATPDPAAPAPAAPDPTAPAPAAP
ncbi:LOW QUALITY PROTEIN: alcohol dehydrogenase, zinc-containing, partial [Streptomyces sp. e14]